MKITRAEIARNFLMKIGANRPNSQQLQTSLLKRVATSFSIVESIEFQADILIRELKNIVELEVILRDSDLHDEIKTEYLGQLSRLRTYLSPAHWEADITQWHQDLAVVLKGLLQIDAIVKGQHFELVADEDVLLAAADKLEEALAELREFDTDLLSQKAKLIQSIVVLIQFLRNSRCLPIDDAINLFLNAIWGVAEFKAKASHGGAFTFLLGALMFANSQISDVREVPENLKWLGSVASTIYEATKNPASREYKPPLGLPAPSKPKTESRDEDEMGI
jgi:hypothetical protein